MKYLRALILSASLLCVASCSETTDLPTLQAGAVVLAFGDSITHGTGAGSGQNYPTLLGQATGWEIINAGIPGDTAQAARERIEPLLSRHRPDLVIVELGGNDFLRRRNPAEVKVDLEAILSRVAAAGVPAVLVSVPQFSVLRATMGALNDSPIYRELADERDLLLIPDLLSDILSREEWKADPVHPNAAGYQALASGIHAALQGAGIAP
ncbi:arylesterase [Parahaliea maris]|uniref:Arylesterase n=1 Tax=Parahaliea maris TaxID=2716870 RepID=A0A5C9A8Z1_9GAMM|nr:GDSL-type esterase/lipase family protein [Parahaliea maris]TXS96532.1 arylesterase [Parahaliea maris]